MVTSDLILGAKILIVDDEADNISVLEKMLGLEGYSSIESTTDPRKVLNIYKDFLPDLVLMDLKMPHMDGFEVMEQLREIEKGSYHPVLVLTALKDEETLYRALDGGAKDLINKPFDSRELLARIRNLLEVRLLYKKLESQNLSLSEKIGENKEELRESRLEIIRRLGMAAEYRDNETGLHIIRMSKISVLMGKAMGMEENQCDLLLNASPMHDVGKIGIPDKVLLKPSALTSMEWEIMKTHSTIGANLLGGHKSDLMEMARTIALTHHEKWDGTGYPNGLKGENIPLEGRICALCDSFDALVSVRPYKKAWTIEDSVSEINRGSGKSFDPELVKIFKKIFSDVLKIIEEHAD